MNSPTVLFQQYVNRVGGRSHAAARLGIGVAMVGHILCGRRGISTDVAKAIEADTNGEMSRVALRPDVFGDQQSAA